MSVFAAYLLPDLPLFAHKAPAGRWLSETPDSAPGGQPVPLPDPVEEEIEALATLLADVVELTHNGAVYPGHLALIVEQSSKHGPMRACSEYCGASGEHLAS